MSHRFRPWLACACKHPKANNFLSEYSRSSAALQNRPPGCSQRVRRQPFNRVTGVQEQSSARLLAVLSAERTKMRGIRRPRTRSWLNFDRQQLATRLDHAIHFLANGRAPIAQLRALDARIAPRRTKGVYAANTSSLERRNGTDFGQTIRDTSRILGVVSLQSVVGHCDSRCRQDPVPRSSWQ